MMYTRRSVRRTFGPKQGLDMSRRFGLGRVGMCMWVGVVLLVCSSYGWGATVGGRFTTSLYSWEQQGTDGKGTGHLRAAQAAMLHVGRVGVPGLSFHTYVQVSSDVRVEESGDPRVKVYHGYMDWERAIGALSLRMGRQLVYEGVGNGVLDGLWVGYALGSVVQVTGYAGMLPSLEGSNRLRSWSDGHLMGLRFRIRKVYGTTVQVSVVRRVWQPVSYLSWYSGKVIESSALEQEWVGVDLRRRIGGDADVFGRLDVDVIFERIRRAELAVRYMVTPALQLTGVFVHRVPVVDANSVFSVFSQRTNQQVRLSGTYRIYPQLYVFSGVEHGFYDGDTATRMHIGASIGGNSLSYNRGVGYMGTRDGISGGFRYPVGEKVWVKANAQFTRYALFDGAEDPDEVVTASVGVTYRPTRGSSFDLEGQRVQNKVYRRDFRIFFRGSVWFFQGERVTRER